MLKSKKIVPIMGVVLIIAILFTIFGTPRYQSIKVKNEKFLGLENKLKKAVNTNTGQFFMYYPNYPNYCLT